MTTKYIKEHSVSNTNKKRNQEDRPIIISKEEFEQMDNTANNTVQKREYQCTGCNIIMMRINDSEYYCNNCHKSISPTIDVDARRIVEKVEVPLSDEEYEPSISIIDDERYASSTKYGTTLKQHTLKGGFAQLAKKGIRITSYIEQNPK